MNLSNIDERLNQLIHYIGYSTHVKTNNHYGGNMPLLTFDQWCYSKNMDELVLEDAPRIPRMTHKLSKYWLQPDVSRVFLYGDIAKMDKRAFDLLKEYSSTIPTGAYIGKMWKRKQDGKWFLCWYGENANPDLLTINMKELILMPDSNYLYMYDRERTLIIESQVDDFQYYKTLQNKQIQNILKAKNN